MVAQSLEGGLDTYCKGRETFGDRAHNGGDRDTGLGPEPDPDKILSKPPSYLH